MTPPLLSHQQEPSEAPTPKRPRGRPKGSKNKATPKGRVGCWGWGLLCLSSHVLGQQVHFELDCIQFRGRSSPGRGGTLSTDPKEDGGGAGDSTCQHTHTRNKPACKTVRLTSCPHLMSHRAGTVLILQAGGKVGQGGLAVALQPSGCSSPGDATGVMNSAVVSGRKRTPSPPPQQHPGDEMAPA